MKITRVSLKYAAIAHVNLPAGRRDHSPLRRMVPDQRPVPDEVLDLVETITGVRVEPHWSSATMAAQCRAALARWAIRERKLQSIEDDTDDGSREYAVRQLGEEHVRAIEIEAATRINAVLGWSQSQVDRSRPARRGR